MISKGYATWVLLALMLSGVACGDAANLPDPGPDAGIDPSQHLSELAPSDMAALCDWIAGRLGGYGRRRTCGSLTQILQDNQTACIMAFQRTSAVCTVGDMESCTNAMVMGPCTAGAAPAACANIFECPAN